MRVRINHISENTEKAPTNRPGLNLETLSLCRKSNILNDFDNLPKISLNIIAEFALFSLFSFFVAFLIYFQKKTSALQNFSAVFVLKKGQGLPL